ncbi:hypothetical protein [Luteimonas sp. MHLX1A]|uniref:hypothetical protein n=1 Tax=Alterluteimonas muca TaxID=2878684 RepID=UPI001E59566C|nr:hypothetical protein [Luteimonas sp. MHLX1A]MCD9047442.1 hypothetical protein [Luteimonas sp. MHLX1A]
MNAFKLSASIALALALAACSPSTDTASTDAPAASATDTAPADGIDVANAPADEFMAAIAHHCGQAFEGRVVTNEPASKEPDAFEGQRLVMHVRGCDDPTRELKVPFHVGDDHSRTWVLTRTDTGMRLKHDHRHEDGSEDAVTMYGGDTAAAGTAQRQEFPVDAESIATFEHEGLNASVTNTWAMEIEPDQRFLYELSRPGGRMFQVEFDLTRPVDLPPTPWGHE